MTEFSHAVTLWLPKLGDTLKSQPREELSSLKLPALQVLLAKADAFGAVADDFYSRGCYLFHQQQTLPVASTMAATQITDSGKDFWIRAEPVQMIADRDSLVMMPPETLSITAAESEALFEAFNRHFKVDGLQLEWGSHQDWYCRLPQIIDLPTTPLIDAIYQNVNSLYPKGSAARYWHQLINETQMLFHTHPVNEARRLNGQPEINSLWFWGEGQYDHSQVILRKEVTLWSDDLYLKGLAKRTQALTQNAVKNSQAWLTLAAQQSSDQHLIHLDDFSNKTMAVSGIEGLKQLEVEWFSPLLEQLQLQQIHSLLLDFGGTQRYHLTPKHLKRFWHFRKALNRHL